VLTVLQQKLAEVHGLAMSATVVTHKVEERIDDPVLVRELETMRDDAEETRARCLLVEKILPEELFEELRAHANSTHETGADLVGAWFKAGTDPLRAWTFLAMGEAGEVSMWSALAVLAADAEEPNVAELVEWALPIQRRHLATALSGVVTVAAAADAVGPRWG